MMVVASHSWTQAGGRPDAGTVGVTAGKGCAGGAESHGLAADPPEPLLGGDTKSAGIGSSGTEGGVLGAK